jgi:methanogenic corrinoid protein MtbC1
MDRNSQLEPIAAAVKDGDDEKARSLCESALQAGVDPREIIQKGLSRGMHEVGELFGSGEMFVPELLVAAEAMNAGISVLLPSLKGADDRKKEKVVIGVVEGDVHGIGKNLVKVMLEADGFEVLDLGFDVPAEKFLEEVSGSGARVLALSTMMTTTLPNMRKTVELAGNLQPKPVTIVGGAPLSEDLVFEMNADGFARDAAQAPGMLRSVLSR